MAADYIELHFCASATPAVKWRYKERKRESVYYEFYRVISRHKDSRKVTGAPPGCLVKFTVKVSGKN